MLLGLLLGLLSATGGGLSNLAVAVAARRIGSIPTLAGTQLSGLILFAAAAVVLGTTLEEVAALAVPAFAVAVVSSLTYLSFFVGLRLGPLSVVGPTVSAYGGLVVVIAVVVLGEPLRPLQATGVVLAWVGIMLAGVRRSADWSSIRLIGPGVGFAMLATVGFALNVLGLRALVAMGGWLPALLAWRAWTALITIVLLLGALMIRRSPPIAASSRRSLHFVVAAGLADAAATIALSIGLEVSYAWLVGLVSSWGPLSGVLAGVAVFGERLTRVQAGGLTLVAASLLFLGLG